MSPRCLHSGFRDARAECRDHHYRLSHLGRNKVVFSMENKRGWPSQKHVLRKLTRMATDVGQQILNIKQDFPLWYLAHKMFSYTQAKLLLFQRSGYAKDFLTKKTIPHPFKSMIKRIFFGDLKFYNFVLPLSSIDDFPISLVAMVTDRVCDAGW